MQLMNETRSAESGCNARIFEIDEMDQLHIVVKRPARRYNLGQDVQISRSGFTDIRHSTVLTSERGIEAEQSKERRGSLNKRLIYEREV